MKYVIIGNSAAGIGAVEGIRSVDKQGEIKIITDEAYHTYSRPLISYLLLGKVTEEKMKYRGDGFYSDNNVTLLKNSTVIKIDAEKKQISLCNGNTESYDKLLVASGSSPFVPPFEGIENVKNKVTFMSLDDAHKLDEMLSKKAGAKVLIIGAGLIGLKCAEGIQKRASKITVVDLAPRILSSILDEDGAKIVQEHLEKQGVEFKLASSVKKFEENSAIFEGGEKVDFDALVLAVGVRPNTSLLKDIANIDRGIIVNGKSETSAKDIYAAGDCTQTLDVSSGQNKIMALLPNAYMQGECAGINMACGSDACAAQKSFDKAIPMNAIGFFGLHMITAGNYTGETFLKNEQGSDQICYKKLFYSDNKLNGFILIGDVEKAGIYTSLIRERTPLDSIDFDLICEKPGLMAFTKEDRKIKLGGER
ncbi:MAG: FAD-dependent oxidoreductase [Treponema sp.]|nr:FAD-dependent oxidoreductase [Treponema sp.]MCL2237518.1 FAD-dependent oxidoreductase [Treponema sp.]